MQPQPDLIFTPSLFYKYAKAPHWIWHDIHTDPELKGELSELAEKLIDQGQLHEQEFIKEIPCIEVAEKDIQKAVQQTRQLMVNGAERIYQGALEWTRDGIRHLGRPDLLEKRKGQSRFGDYFYTPVDIKSSSIMKKPHRQQLTLYALMLEIEQDFLPTQTGIIDSKRQRIPFIIEDKHIQDVLDTRDAIVAIAKGTKPALRLSSSYKETPWYDVCLREAIDSDDIALIYNLDYRSLDELRKAGVRTIQDAAGMNVQALPKIPYAGPDRLTRAKIQAQSLLTNEVIWLGDAAIPESKTRLYFDIEGDPLLGVEYLFGFWVVEDGVEPYFEYFVAEKPDDEERMWRSFLDWMERLPQDYCIYHYADYERARLIALEQQYGGALRIGEFKSRLVDLAKVVQECVILPLYFYSIKDIAKSEFLNFKWRHQQAGGAQSIFWYEKWLETGNQTILQEIIDYNEDDVRATEHLHRWLALKEGRWQM